ncbi:nuclear transport factor 2 family protein [Actinoplanes sp. ATCC 53533]|uniref:nuclear transport factor 2 family protein n=1 Tax=Actinoplanes sp. ATCC 53533 TaxID=1288362 RepID=UPI00210503DE|nr:nuclear transport factor 2 family protein [Actinoplanes sp. ATCC 53533]
MLQDRERIADVLTTLAFACDDKNWEQFGRLFTDRLHYDASRHSGKPAADLTVEEFTAVARGVLDGFDCTHHALSNKLITVAGDEARCRAYVVAYHYVAAEPGAVDYCVMRGYCTFGLRRIRDEWLISRWEVVRTAPLEGSPEVYRIAAEKVARHPYEIGSS